MTIPDYQTLMLPLLQRAVEKEVRVPEIIESIASEFNLTSDERNQMLRSGTQRVLENRLYWAKIYLARAGLLDTPSRGKFIITEAGKDLLSKKPERITNNLLRQYPAFEEFYRGSRQTDGGSEESASSELSQSKAITPEEQIDIAYQAVTANLRSDLIERILQNSPSFFEELIVNLLVSMGYGGSRKNAAEQLGRSGDGGVDGVINEDRLGLDRVYVQAKLYTNTNVGRPDVQAFVGSLVGLGATKGVFVTTSSFSQQAVDFVRHLSQRIILIDGPKLADLMIEHNVGVRINRSIEFKRIDEDFFASDE
jgi:restriction system protein